jgi:RimJ/RimL family protein N-acetyltransferase
MAQATFLAGFVEEAIAQSGIGNLSEEQKKYYIPQITALLEERIGLELLPKLSDKQMEDFAEMAASDAATAEQWKAFWEKNIPNFDEEMKRILADFAAQTKASLGK